MYCGQYILDREIHLIPALEQQTLYTESGFGHFFFRIFSNVEERYFDERDSKVNNIGRQTSRKCTTDILQVKDSLGRWCRGKNTD